MRSAGTTAIDTPAISPVVLACRRSMMPADVAAVGALNLERGPLREEAGLVGQGA